MSSLNLQQACRSVVVPSIAATFSLLQLFHRDTRQEVAKVGEGQCVHQSSVRTVCSLPAMSSPAPKRRKAWAQLLLETSGDIAPLVDADDDDDDEKDDTVAPEPPSPSSVGNSGKDRCDHLATTSLGMQIGQYVQRDFGPEGEGEQGWIARVKTALAEELKAKRPAKRLRFATACSGCGTVGLCLQVCLVVGKGGSFKHENKLLEVA